MLIWKAKAAKSTGALKSVSVHQFDNTFTMKTSNCKAFSIDTCLQLRLQGLRKFRLFSFLQEVEKTSTVQYFFWNRDSVYGSGSLTKACIISDSGRHAATLWHRYLQFFSSLLPTDAANSPQRIQLPSLSLSFPVWRNLFCGAHLFSVWEHKEAQIQLFTLIVCVSRRHTQSLLFSSVIAVDGCVLWEIGKRYKCGTQATDRKVLMWCSFFGLFICQCVFRRTVPTEEAAIMTHSVFPDHVIQPQTAIYPRTKRKDEATVDRDLHVAYATKCQKLCIWQP